MRTMWASLAGVEVIPIPANVPRELPVVKRKAHNILWITSRLHSISHNVCTTWPKLFPMRFFGYQRRGESESQIMVLPKECPIQVQSASFYRKGREERRDGLKSFSPHSEGVD